MQKPVATSIGRTHERTGGRGGVTGAPLAAVDRGSGGRPTDTVASPEAPVASSSPQRAR